MKLVLCDVKRAHNVGERSENVVWQLQEDEWRQNRGAPPPTNRKR